MAHLLPLYFHDGIEMNELSDLQKAIEKGGDDAARGGCMISLLYATPGLGVSLTIFFFHVVYFLLHSCEMGQ
jgi:hypothetical protein